MDSKKELSNFRRLQSLKEKKQERNIQAKLIKSSLSCLDSKSEPSNKKIIFASDDESDVAKECVQDVGNKKEEEPGTMQLFDSDGEDGDDEDIVDQFRYRPHLKQQKKLEFLEATGDKRFQLTDVFMEDMECEEEEEQIAKSDDEKEEKQKNLEILQGILGFQLSKTIPAPPTTKRIKKYVHFNPEDEESQKYLKKAESKTEKRTEKEETPTTAEPQVSSLRYFEVSADLKNVLEGAGEEFRFSKAFGHSDELEGAGGEFRFSQAFGHSDESDECNEVTMSDTWETNRSPQHAQESTKSKEFTIKKADSLRFASAPPETCDTEKHQKFFILPGDTRLTQGIEFFKRDKSEEQIREEFFKTRETVLEILKQKHRRGVRAHHVVKNKRRF